MKLVYYSYDSFCASSNKDGTFTLLISVSVILSVNVYRAKNCAIENAYLFCKKQQLKAKMRVKKSDMQSCFVNKIL